VYPIKFEAYHTNYSSNVATLETPFIITIIDPCDEPVSVTASTLTDQEYTITDNVATYTVPVYTANPSWCAITYTYTIKDSEGNVVGNVSFDPLTFDSDELIR